MRYWIAFSVLLCIIASCGNTDKKVTPEQAEKAISDTANYTTIEWIDSVNQNLGNLKEGKVLEVIYKFKNSGNTPLIVQDVSASCGCTVPVKPEKPILPGETGEIKAVFDSANRPEGENIKQVYVRANTIPNTETILSFRVNVTK